MEIYISTELFLDFRSGDSKAEKAVYMFYGREITYFAMELIRNDTEAENIAARAYGDLVKKRKSITTREMLDEYLYRTVSEYCDRYLKGHQLPTIEHFITPAIFDGEQEVDVKNPISGAKFRAKGLAVLHRKTQQSELRKNP